MKIEKISDIYLVDRPVLKSLTSAFRIYAPLPLHLKLKSISRQDMGLEQSLSNCAHPYIMGAYPESC